MTGADALLTLVRSAVTGGVLGATGSPVSRLRNLDFAPFGPALAGLPDARRHELEGLVPAASAVRLGELLATGRLTATELALACLSRVRRLDGTLNSLIELNPGALAEAAESDRRRAEGRTLGPLDGIPVTLKDNIATAGPMHTTGGAAVLADHVAGADAAIVASLRTAGLVILGKANLSELAGAVSRVPGVSAVGGRTVNRYGQGFSPGGSSSGSAVAVAAGLCPVSVGTETSGSLVAPSAFNGVVGLKPSRGVLSTDGIIPLVGFQDCPGPVARTVADAAALFAALGGPTAGLDDGSLTGVRAGLLGADILAQPRGLEDPADNPAMLDRIRVALAEAGAVVVDAAVAAPEPVGAFEAGFPRVALGGLAHDTMDYLARAGAAASTLGELARFNLARPRERMPKGQFLLALALLWQVDRPRYEALALDYRARATAICDATFAVADAGVLVSLSNRHSTLYATAGLPAITVPLGLRANGMPTGATLIGRFGEDARLLGFASAFERAVGGGEP